MNKFINIALKEAYKAYKKEEVPVGAVIVKNNKIISKAHNTRVRSNKVISHAEINAILKANKKLKDWRLTDCDLYVTLKPCNMCEIFIKESRIRNVYYLIDSLEDKNQYSKTIFEQTFDSDEKTINYYKELLNDFFKKKR